MFKFCVVGFNIVELVVFFFREEFEVLVFFLNGFYEVQFFRVEFVVFVVCFKVEVVVLVVVFSWIKFFCWQNFGSYWFVEYF